MGTKMPAERYTVQVGKKNKKQKTKNKKKDGPSWSDAKICQVISIQIRMLLHSETLYQQSFKFRRYLFIYLFIECVGSTEL